MKKSITLAIYLVSITMFAQKQIFTTAKVKSATVYFSAAEIGQSMSVNLPKGTSEIVVKNVAENLNESTIRVGAPASVTVLSVQFTDDYMLEFEVDEKNPAIKKVRDSITIVQKLIQKNNLHYTSINNSMGILTKNEIFGGTTGLNVLELTKLVDFNIAKRTDLSLQMAEIQDLTAKLQVKLSNLSNKLEINTSKEEKSSNGKLIIQVMNETAGVVDFDINYIASNVTWRPFYDLRATNISDPINMMYKAEVIQNTGIDWKKIKLTLSSGNPNQNNQQPELNAWFLRYNVPYVQDDEEADQSAQKMLQEVVVQSAPIRKDKMSKGYFASTVGAQDIENQLNVSFDIDIPYDILSNGKVHSVALKEIKLPASFKYYAAPRVEKEAFLLAQINDYSKYNLLQGQANIIFEGMYVGKTNINPNQVSDTLSLSMGRDKKIAIKREKVVDKSGTKFLSSKKEQTFTFDITVRNNKKEAIELLLKDQYPLSPDKEIEIELLESDKALVNTETGVLTWNLNMKPLETKKIRISYKVRYPKDKVIDNL